MSVIQTLYFRKSPELSLVDQVKSLQMRIDDTLRVSHKAISLHSNVILSNKNDNSHIHNVITKACFIIMLQISESETLIGVDD